MAWFPTSPTDGQIYILGSTPYVYASSNNSWTQTTDANLTAGNIKNGVTILGVTGSYAGSAALGNIYISPLNLPVSWYDKFGTAALLNSCSFNISNIIYVPVVASMQDDGSNVRIYLYLITFTSDSSAAVARTGIPTTFFNISFSSIYLDSRIIYFNLANNYYYTYTISSGIWSSYISWSHTSGTLENSLLTLNWRTYWPAIVYGSDPNPTQNASYGLWAPLVQVT